MSDSAGIVGRMDRTTSGQFFEVLVWLLNIVGVAAIAMLAWFMTNLYDKVEKIEDRTRAVEITLSRVVQNAETLTEINRQIVELTARIAKIPDTLPPPWLLDRVEKLERRIASIESRGQSPQKGAR